MKLMRGSRQECKGGYQSGDWDWLHSQEQALSIRLHRILSECHSPFGCVLWVLLWIGPGRRWGIVDRSQNEREVARKGEACNPDQRMPLQGPLMTNAMPPSLQRATCPEGHGG